jgi:hypothetical protein
VYAFARAANELIVPMSAHSLVVPFHLLDTICARFLQGLVESSDISFHLFIRRQVFIGGPVPSTIEAENNPLHKAPLKVEDDKLCVGLSIFIWIPRVSRARRHPFQLPADAKVAATNAIKGRQASTAGLPTIKPTMAWPKR